MLRQLNVKRQLTIPAPLAKRFGFSSKGWVDVSEKHGTLVIIPVDLEIQRTKPLELSDHDWKVLNQKVRQELRAGKGRTYPDAKGFLRDLKRRMSARSRSTAR